MNSIKYGFILAAAVVTGAFAPYASGAQGHHQQGIVGSVPITRFGTPPEGQDEPGTPPFVRVYTESGKLVAEVEAEADGTTAYFLIALKPGRYVVWAYYPPEPTPECNFCQFTEAVSVTVERKKYSSVESLTWRPL